MAATEVNGDVHDEAPDRLPTTPVSEVSEQITRSTIEATSKSVSGQCGPQCWLKYLKYDSFDRSRYDNDFGGTGQMFDKHVDDRESFYETLLPWQTRVLRIHKGKPGSEVECDLLVADLVCYEGVGLPSTREIVLFDALSYSWGYPEATVGILCNGRRFPVSRAILVVLSRLRQVDADRYVWIDAICINQKDNGEKSAQVSNMFVIYQKATKVVAWLGLPEEGACNPLPAMRRFALAAHDKTELAEVHDEVCLKQLPVLAQGLSQLLNRPWFARTWIRQEVLANRQTEITFGAEVISFDSFANALDHLNQTPVMRNLLLPVCSDNNYSCYQTLRYSRARPGTDHVKEVDPASISGGLWLESLLNGSKFGAADNRDRLYAVVGLAKSRVDEWTKAYCRNVTLLGPNAPTIDYKKTVSIVYQDAVHFLITRHGNLLPLLIFQKRSLDSSLPSWVVDLQSDIVRWFIGSHLPVQDLSNMPQGFRKKNFATWTKLLKQPQLMFKWYSFRGKFDLTNVKLASTDGELILRGYRLGHLRGLYNVHDMWHGLEVGKPLTRAPLSPLMLVKSDRQGAKRSATEVGVTAATVDTLIKECSQKVMWLDVLPNLKPDLDLSLCRTLLVTEIADEDDEVVLLHGSSLPLVLRPTMSGAASTYHFLGPALWLTEPDAESDHDSRWQRMLNRSVRLLDRGEQHYKSYCDALETHAVVEDFVLV